MNQHSGRRVIVTGSEGGLGRALVARLLESGASVARLDRAGTGADHEVDLTDAEAAGRAVDSAAEQLGGLDAVIGAAGVVDTIHRAEKFPPEAFVADMESNLFSQFFVARASFRHLTQSEAPAIVMVASVAGLDGLTGQLSYAASKAGVVGLAKSLAAEWVSRGIRVNVVAPGLFATPKVLGMPQEIRDRVLGGVPMGRIASLDEVVEPTLFMISEASGYMTGQALRLDGGFGLGVTGIVRG